ncbi:MAG TPA: SlyX family protein [Gammaproteobacteria bacterium]|nr:SlyX family protein [Gammaproteobacteria bacterium]
MEERIITLETKIAFQEHLLEELNQIVTRQQEEISVLTLGLKKLNEQIKQMAPANLATIEQETPPPHY